jgi:stage II sporulation protein AA (anti-sigma F factor antagonist)
MFGRKEPSPFFTARKHGDTATVLAVQGQEMRHPEPSRQFGDAVRAYVEKEDPAHVIIDLEKALYLGSTAFAVLIGLAEWMKERGGTLRICNIQPDVEVGANIIGLGRVVDTYPDEHSALQSFQP